MVYSSLFKSYRDSILFMLSLQRSYRNKKLNHFVFILSLVQFGELNDPVVRSSVRNTCIPDEIH